MTRSFGLERGFPGVPLIAFTSYVAALAPVAVIWALLWGRRYAALAAGLAAVALFVAVLPRTLAAEPAAGEGPALRVMSSNLRFGGADVGDLAAQVERNDVQLLSPQELYSSVPLRAGAVTSFAPGRPGVRTTVKLSGAAPVEAFAIHPLPPTGPRAVGELGDYLDAIPPPTSSEPG